MHHTIESRANSLSFLSHVAIYIHIVTLSCIPLTLPPLSLMGGGEASYCVNVCYCASGCQGIPVCCFSRMITLTLTYLPSSSLYIRASLAPSLTLWDYILSILIISFSCHSYIMVVKHKVFSHGSRTSTWQQLLLH